MNADWIFVGNGVRIGNNIKAKAKNGTVGVTSMRELYIYGDNGEIIDHAPIMQTIIKFSNVTGDSVKMNGNKYMLAFVPPIKTSTSIMHGMLGGAVGGFVAGLNESQRPEVQFGRQKREEFKALIERIQAENGMLN
ncbi:MAG: hypothetical protein LBM09_00245 [Candidatus Nomurabacteria bacterium]|jgi:hypothetical protein|nr:hypothetical protein [Candidatus Nomurabacteria bacterium]